MISCRGSRGDLGHPPFENSENSQYPRHPHKIKSSLGPEKISGSSPVVGIKILKSDFTCSTELAISVTCWTFVCHLKRA